MAIKKGLGKGLSALLPADNAATLQAEEESKPSPDSESSGANNTAAPQSAEVNSGAQANNADARPAAKSGGEISVPVEKLKANPGQPRKNFDEAELAELADSIKQQGIIQPLIVEEGGDGDYTIIAGERRARAARIAGLKKVPVIVRKYSDEKRMVVSLIENIQRANLNPIEESAAYKQLMDAEKLSQDEVAAKVGKNRATVANALRLLKLPPAIQESLRNGELSSGHARAILSVPGAKTQEILFREIIKKGLSVREAEKRAAAMNSQNKKSAKSATMTRRAPEIEAMTEKFITRLGTKVAINGDLNHGTIMIDYFSMEDLDRLYEILGG